MLDRIKDIIQRKRNRFDKICKACELNLSYSLNKETLSILEDIFIRREYSDSFPFYEQVTIVDVGAHHGYFSIFASKNTDEASHIYAIEPSRINFGVLQKNFSACDISNVTALQIAIGEKVGIANLYEGRSENNTLLIDYPLLTDIKSTSTVKVFDLNSLIIENRIDKIDFLKMDCEGSEYSILLNAPASVFEKIKVISMEFHDLKNSRFTGNRLIEKLKSNGFRILKYTYCMTSLNLNYGKIIAKRNLDVDISN